MIVDEIVIRVYEFVSHLDGRADVFENGEGIGFQHFTRINCFKRQNSGIHNFIPR